MSMLLLLVALVSLTAPGPSWATWGWGSKSSSTRNIAASSTPLNAWPNPHAGLQHVKIDGKTVAEILGPVLNWTYSLPQSALRKGLGYVGANFRLRRVVRDMLSGKKPVKIGIVGGTVSAADKGPSKKGTTDWSSLLSHYVSSSFHGHNITVKNGALAGVDSIKMVQCLERAVDNDVDIIFSDFLFDDDFAPQIVGNPKTAGYEQLVRRMLSLPSRPAVIMVQTMRWGAAADPKVATADLWKPFHLTLEDVYGAMSQYYDIQWLSFRDATYRLTHKKPTPGLTYADLMTSGEDRGLPADGGHRVLADLAVWLLQQTAVDLALRPFDHADAEQAGEPLPPPMIPGNEAPAKPACAA